MNINRDFLSKNNINGTGNPCKYIVIHETDNTRAGANARAHAAAQHDGNFEDMSVHYYCGSDGIYQAAEHTCKCWHVGRLYVTTPNVPSCNNNNSIGVEICVNSDGDYYTARKNAIELTRYLIQTTGIPADRVIRHYDAKGKYCPRKMLDNPSLWEDFKSQIRESGSVSVEPAGDTYTVQSGDTLSKIAKTWGVPVADLARANGINNPDVINVGQVICKPAGPQPDPAPQPSGNPIVRDGQIHANNFTGAGIAVGGIPGPETEKAGTMVLQTAINLDYDAGIKVDGFWGSRSDAALGNHYVCLGENQEMVRALQILLMIHGYDPHGVDGSFGAGTEAAVRQYQADHGLAVDGIAGRDTFKSLIA